MLTKKQKMLAKKFGAFRKRQAAQRARFAKIREEIEQALLHFAESSDELSRTKLRREQKRILTLVQRTIKRTA